MAPIRVVVSDDHPVVRSGIRLVLEREPDIEIVGEAADGVEALRLAMDLVPDVLLLDIEMPGMTGIEVTRAVCAAGLPTHVLAMSAHDDEQYISRMLSLGAAGYLTKDEPHAVIVAAIRGVTRMERGWFSRRVTARMMTDTPEQATARGGLTEREREVLRWLVVGKTNQGIARVLDISEKTVERHVGSVFEKLRVASRVEAAVCAVREQLV